MEDIKNYETMSVQERWNVLAMVANMYYNTELTQNQLSSKTLDILEKKGAVGHIGGRFFDIFGRELDTALAERMIGIDFGRLKEEQELVCIACGEKKAEPVLGVLRGNYIGTLIIDEKCAEKILHIKDTPA